VFRTLDDFFGAYGHLTAGTGKVFAALNNKNLSRRVAPGHRTLGDLAWHIVVTIPEMMNKTGLALSSVDPEAMPPASARKIATAYKKVTAELVQAISADWRDKTLFETDEMYGEKWPRGSALFALVTHEVHHVGQMTVLLRQAKSKVPGLFGPSKEEWKKMGMEPPPY
jgi:uncharacterized damage-inducible protein DinB